MTSLPGLNVLMAVFLENIKKFTALNNYGQLKSTGLLTALASSELPGWPDCTDCGSQKENIMSFPSLHSSGLL